MSTSAVIVRPEIFKSLIIKLVDWGKVWSPLKKEGLEIWKFKHFYQALIGNWLWRFGV